MQAIFAKVCNRIMTTLVAWLRTKDLRGAPQKKAIANLGRDPHKADVSTVLRRGEGRGTPRRLVQARRLCEGEKGRGPPPTYREGKGRSTTTWLVQALQCHERKGQRNPKKAGACTDMHIPKSGEGKGNCKKAGANMIKHWLMRGDEGN